MQAAQSQETLAAELDRVNAELAARGRTDNFYTSLAASYARYGSFTERQEQALRHSLTQRAAREIPVTAPVPQGRVQITGTVLTVKWQENDFGGSLKMLVQADAGWKVYGTVPASIAHLDTLKGLRITFTATVQPKEAGFGFFSRPTNGSVIEAEAPVAPAAPAPVLLPKASAPAPTVCTNQPAFAPANKLADIIAQAKAREAAKQSTRWDTESMN